MIVGLSMVCGPEVILVPWLRMRGCDVSSDLSLSQLDAAAVGSGTMVHMLFSCNSHADDHSGSNGPSLTGFWDMLRPPGFCESV